MTAPRPRIPPDLAAALIAAVPARLARKLDAAPTLAETWQWTETVTTDKGEVVRLALDAGIVTAVTCSCLLQPRCLHVAAVVAALEPAAERKTAQDAGDPAAARDHAGATAVPDAGEPAAAAGGATPAAGGDAARLFHAAEPAVSDDERAAAALSAAALAAVLAAGAEASGALAQAELLRAIHACRAAGLHRLAAAQTRALHAIRDLRADRPEFALAALAADLRDALAVAHALVTGAAEPGLRGTARRDYEPIGNLRLRGVFTEAVVARSGYAGAITYLADDRGALYTRADVAPGDAGRAAGAYDAPAGIGDAVLSHRELGRGGLFVEHATASADGRLGAGQRVRAVRAGEPSRWDQPPLDARFAVPLIDQLAQIAARTAITDELRPAGWDLIFVEGVLAGGPGWAGLAVARTADPGEPRVAVRLRAAPHAALPARDNLVTLSRAAGLAVRAIGRVRLAAPRELDLLAVGPAPGETRFALPDDWLGRANVHYDRIAGLPAAAAGAAVDISLPAVTAPGDLLAPLRRRIERAVLGGAGTLPPHALAEIDSEAAALAARSLGTAAELLRDLAAFAHATARSATGARDPLDPAAFARAWLRAAVYEVTASRRLSLACW